VAKDWVSLHDNAPAHHLLFVQQQLIKNDTDMPTHPEVTLRDTYLFSLKKD
jgi:hypothetical protein